MLHFGVPGKKKDELDEWLVDEFFPIIISGDQLAVKKAPVKIDNQPTKVEVQPKVVIPPAKAKTIKKIRKGALPSGINTGTVSVKSMLEEKEVKDQDEEIEDFSNRPRTPFTEEEFKHKWTSYIDKLKEDRRTSLASTLQSCHPELKDKFELLMVFDNIVQEAEFNNAKSGILGFLRESLNNWGILINTEVREVSQQKNYYTNRERFERMTELNPKLEELRKKLNLDPDY